MNNLDLYEYAERENITVEHVDLQKNKALSVKIGSQEYIGIDKNIADDSAEERTRLAHELGHCATGAFYDTESPLCVRGKSEYRAYKWAVLRCVPKDKLIAALKNGHSKTEIAEQFGVSEQLIDKAIQLYFEFGIAG